jgi:hypothetical protein
VFPLVAQANALAKPVAATTALATPLYVTDDFLVGVSAFTTDQTAQSPTVNIGLRRCALGFASTTFWKKGGR